MTEEQKALFRKAILRVLDANRTRFGLGLPAVGHLTVQFGFASPKSDELADAMDYLEKKELVEEVLKSVNRSNRCWRITEKGIAFLDEGQ